MIDVVCPNCGKAVYTINLIAGWRVREMKMLFGLVPLPARVEQRPGTVLYDPARPCNGAMLDVAESHRGRIFNVVSFDIYSSYDTLNCPYCEGRLGHYLTGQVRLTAPVPVWMIKSPPVIEPDRLPPLFNSAAGPLAGQSAQPEAATEDDENRDDEDMVVARTLEQLSGTAAGPINIESGLENLVNSIRDEDVVPPVVDDARELPPSLQESMDALDGPPPADPAVSVAAAVREYQRANPAATWKQVYQAVPNDFSNHNSMRAAVQRAFKEGRA